MLFSIQITEEAKNDITEAVEWYRLKAEKLHILFLDKLEKTLQSIRRNPFAFKKVYKQFRQTAVRSFPYVVVYETGQATVLIYAVFNTWQHPAKKLKRLKK